MALVSCTECQTKISSASKSCPSCGHPVEKNNQIPATQAVISIIAAIGIYWFFFGPGADQQIAAEMKKNSDTVAADAVTQYQIAKNQGDKNMICVQSQMVAAAFLQAKDEPSYKLWKDTSESDCKAAGLSN